MMQNSFSRQPKNCLTTVDNIARDDVKTRSESDRKQIDAPTAVCKYMNIRKEFLWKQSISMWTKITDSMTIYILFDIN